MLLKDLSPQDATVITTSAKETTAQEPQEDAQEDADNLYAKHATDVITVVANNTTYKLYFHNPVMPCNHY
jgi:hypothetical protein